MPDQHDFLLGEVARSLDERYRVSIPGEMVDWLSAAGGDLTLAKEQPGCLSLWAAPIWQSKLEEGIELVRSKMKAGRLEGKVEEVQLLGRLLSTRHTQVRLAGRGRLLIPEGFREFLGVEPGGDVMIVGAALCMEIWNPSRWITYLEDRMPQFRQLLDRLSG